MKDFNVTLNGFDLEYFDRDHLYLVNGVCVPSITQILKWRFPDKYDGIRRETLDQAAAAGTAVHEAVERYVNDGEESDVKELRNFRFMEAAYNFKPIRAEVPVILFSGGQRPIAAGRMDLVIRDAATRDIGLADIKRTATIDREYIAYQLNLYRIAYRQSYGIEAAFLRGIHLREDVRKYVKIPVAESWAMRLIRDFIEERKEER